MAAVLLSKHSSNPLEVPSSDARNKSYVRQFKRAKQVRGNEPTSDDPLNNHNVPEMEDYHSHLSQLYPHASVLRHPKPATPPPVTTVPAKDMLSDEELADETLQEGDTDMQEHDPDGEADEEGEDEDGEDDESAGDADVHGETDEEMTIFLKPADEQDEIEEEIADLEAAVPQLTPDYKIVDRLGTGTFSSVYKAVDLGYHDKWYNAPWHGFHPPESSAHYQSISRSPENKVFVAIKRIYVTSGPERIRNELSILEDCRGCRHVSQLITAFRERDQVVAIMPYHRNEDFRDYFRVLPMDGIKAYFRCMFRALRDVHARGIIHRDVKPANFLFDPRTGIGTLCDFGLACRMERGPTLGACLHTAPSRQYPHGRVLSREEFNVDYVRRMQKEGRAKSLMPSDKVGYPEKDLRPHSKANRAGTRGFRAPEVLLKCGEQTGAIDVWSAGAILLFFLTGKFPLFHSNDDVEALMEIASIIGKQRVEKVATIHSRVFQSNVPTLTQEGISWREFVERQNPELRDPPTPDPRFYPYTLASCNSHSHSRAPSSSSSRYSPSRSSSPGVCAPSAEEHAAAVDDALDLAEKLLDPEATRRITPRRALSHPFLHEPGAPSDDEFFPHPFGEGVCRHLHFIDAVTEDMCVRVCIPGTDKMEVRRVVAGEGIAIGRRPCEFHREEDGYKYSR